MCLWVEKDSIHFVVHPEDALGIPVARSVQVPTVKGVKRILECTPHFVPILSTNFKPYRLGVDAGNA
jgi:hypothetical protein